MAKAEKTPAQSLLIPIVGLCVLLLGGLGFLYVMFASSRDHKVATPPETKTEKAPVVSVSRSAPSRGTIQSIDDVPQMHILSTKVAIGDAGALNAKAAIWTGAAAVLGAIGSVLGLF